MYDATTLSNLLISNGLAKSLAPRLDGVLFAPAEPLPQTGRPGEPTHPDTPCSLWRGSIGSSGYGSIGFRGASQRVHIATYILAVGPVPDRHELGHLCERRLCGRPDHVRPVTRRQNTREGSSRVYGDDILSLAPTEACCRCGTALVATVSISKSRRPRWLLTCWTCNSEYLRAKRAGRDLSALSPGLFSRRMPDVALQLLSA